VQAGTKRCSRPNQKITQKRRTECSQIRYPDPKTSPVHETGASPVKDFYAHYSAWTKDMGYTLTQTQLAVTRNLAHLGYGTKKTNQGLAILGLVLVVGKGD
jgi:hypothetical protein